MPDILGYSFGCGGEFVCAYNKEMSLEIFPTVIQKQQLIYTRISVQSIDIEKKGQEYKFGWHVSSASEEYTSFLKQYITGISEALTAKGIS